MVDPEIALARFNECKHLAKFIRYGMSYHEALSNLYDCILGSDDFDPSLASWHTYITTRFRGYQIYYSKTTRGSIHIPLAQRDPERQWDIPVVPMDSTIGDSECTYKEAIGSDDPSYQAFEDLEEIAYLKRLANLQFVNCEKIVERVFADLPAPCDKDKRIAKQVRDYVKGVAR